MSKRRKQIFTFFLAAVVLLSSRQFAEAGDPGTPQTSPSSTATTGETQPAVSANSETTGKTVTPETSGGGADRID